MVTGAPPAASPAITGAAVAGTEAAGAAESVPPGHRHSTPDPPRDKDDNGKQRTAVAPGHDGSPCR